MAEYHKAYICPYRNGRADYGSRFYVQFNPTELSVTEAIGVAETDEGEELEKLKRLLKGNKVGIQRPPKSAEPSGGQNKLTLSVSLFFNTLEQLNQDYYQDVREYVKQLYPYTNKWADSKREAQQIYFAWGTIAVAGFLTAMSVRYTMFAPNGTPVRAQADISIRGDYVGDQPPSQLQGDGKGYAAEFGRNELNILVGEDPSDWRGRFTGSGNPRLM